MVRSAGLNRRNDPPLQLLRNLFVGALCAAVVFSAQLEALAFRPYGVSLHEVRIKCGTHSCIRAIVYVPKVSGQQKKIDVVVYNHGYGTTASGAFTQARLIEQMRLSRPASLLIVPEWQKLPGSRNSDQGLFEKEGQFKALLDAAFHQLPQLKGVAISGMTIVSHSAGYGPTETEIYKNALPQVRSIVLLDSLYDSCGFDPWLKSNIRALSSGEKRFCNIFNDTSKYSRAQAVRVRQFLRAEGLSSGCLLEDYNNGAALLGASAFQEKSIIFKFSSYKCKKGTAPDPSKDANAHDSIAACYIAPALGALAECTMEKKDIDSCTGTARVVKVLFGP